MVVNKLFNTDKQTLDDLNIHGKYKADSIFYLFNKTQTIGGEQLLLQYFDQPLTEIETIRNRQDSIKKFVGLNLHFPVESKSFEILNQYINGFAQTNGFNRFFQTTKREVLSLLGDSGTKIQNDEMLYSSLLVLRKIQNWFANELSKVKDQTVQDYIATYLPVLLEIEEKYSYGSEKPLSFKNYISIESLIKGKYFIQLIDLIKICYELDAHISIATVMGKLNLNFPDFIEGKHSFINAINMYHPSLNNPVANSLSLDHGDNLLFLTGANMAGKSTFMKTLGVNVFLAQLGFPVAAEKFSLTVFEGIYSSINLPDNIKKGYSHFYAEVLRVKEVAKVVADGKKLLVIFDELFKGTNVKDAYEATYHVSNAFLAYKKCVFVLSTHIVEVGHALKQNNTKVSFRYLPTIISNNKATYPYTLSNGISNDRHGMMIIQQEGILNLFPNTL